MKRVKCYDNDEWVSSRVHSFAYDGGNIVLERIVYANGDACTIENFWGDDLSGTKEGAGGVGGLLAISIDGNYCFPCYDSNGNVLRYVSEDGSVAAQFVYDPYGNVLEQEGAAADSLRIRFSTKYADSEVGVVSYLMRFYSPVLGRWLSRDPVGEEGGMNLYGFCGNDSIGKYDKDGCAYFAKLQGGVHLLPGTNSFAICDYEIPTVETLQNEYEIRLRITGDVCAMIECFSKSAIAICNATSE